MKKSLTAVKPQSVALNSAFSVNAFEREAEYLLSLSCDRLLAGFYRNAWLKTPFVRYGGWEDMLIGGHTMGHYLSALSRAYANGMATEEQKSAFYARAVKAVDGLFLCQEHSRGKKGFIWAAVPTVIGGAEAQFDNVERGATNITTHAWVPWYTMHKLLAGILDVYLFTGYGKAKEVASSLGDWVYDRVSQWSEELRLKVLSVEYGGMNDCLYSLYAITQKKEHAIAAHIFDEDALFERILSGQKNALKDKHANTTIPKILGALKRYTTLHGKELDGERVDAEKYLRTAQAFFDTVVEKHTYVTGGNSEWEHFGEDNVLDRERTNCNCETCNVYNMLKLARSLFCVTGDKKYTDYYEQAYVNAILSSQNPKTGMTTYFQPMASGFFKVYSDPYDKFWCCTGSGMENFAKLGDSVFYTDGEGIFAELYQSCTLCDESLGVVLNMQCDFPLQETVTVTVERAAGEFDLYLRIPDWAGGEVTVLKNGKATAAKEENGHLFLSVKTGDELRMHIPCTVTAHGLPDCKNVFAFKWGNAVLSANLGREDLQTTQTGVCVTIPKSKKIATERLYVSCLQEALNNPQALFTRAGDEWLLSGADIPLSFGLHYRKTDERYAIYWYLCEGERQGEVGEEREKIDVVQPGYGQYENDSLHALNEYNSVGVTSDGTYRYAKKGGYFCYQVRVLPSCDMILSVRLRVEDNGKALKITAGDEVLCCEWLFYSHGEEEEYAREFPISSELVARCAVLRDVDGEQVLCLPVRFEGAFESKSARICQFITLYRA